MTAQEVWIVDDDASIRWVLQKALRQARFLVRDFERGDGVVNELKHHRPDLIVTDVRMPGMDGLQLLRRIHEDNPELPIIVMTAHSDLDSAVSSYRGGAFDYLPKPFDIDEALRLIKRAVGHRPTSEERLPTHDGSAVPSILGEASAMQEVFRAIGRLSSSTMNVLICGESGTGKELVARALFENSPRSHSPFVAINTAAIPADLLESELFGHERGAFTGAYAQRRGRFEQAGGGTLFLDEIGDMPAMLQTRLLRVLSDGHYYRVGGHEQLKSDVRIIAATNQDLEQRVLSKDFREDLFHRLNVIRINIPALRERSSDVPVLVNHFMHTIAADLGVSAKTVNEDAMAVLTGFSWPGNVRQLENICRWLTVMAPGQIISAEDLPHEVLHNERPAPTRPAAQDWRTQLQRVVEERLANGDTRLLDTIGAEFERTMIESALRFTRGHKQEAARCLGWGRNTLTRKLKELHIQLPN